MEAVPPVCVEDIGSGTGIGESQGGSTGLSLDSSMESKDPNGSKGEPAGGIQAGNPPDPAEVPAETGLPNRRCMVSKLTELGGGCNSFSKLREALRRPRRRLNREARS